MHVRYMNLQDVMEILTWHYIAPYDFYNLDGSPEMFESYLGGNYFSVDDDDHNLIGYFHYGESAKVSEGVEAKNYVKGNFIDVGLCLRPDMCHQGLGTEFLEKCLDYADSIYPFMDIRITIPDFNERNILFYENVGFKKVKTFHIMKDSKKLNFVIMTLRRS